MANPTTNYSFAMPTNSDLVKDLPADFDIFGQAVDDRIKALNPETTAGDISYRASTANAKTRLAIGTAGQVLQVNSGATAPEWATFSASAMTLISTTTLTGSSVTLSSIPATYKNLQVVIRNARPSVDNTSLLFRFNADSTANRHSQRAFSSDVQDQLTFAATDITFTAGLDDTTSQGLITIDFPDYANAVTWKMATCLSITNDHTDATQFDRRPIFAFYNQTSAISSLSFFPATGNFSAGTLLLYGVK